MTEQPKPWVKSLYPVVSLNELKRILDIESGRCHYYVVTKVTGRYIHVEYTNPDEWGTPHPMTAVYPCYVSLPFFTKENPLVVIDIVRMIRDNHDGEGWQSFQFLQDICKEKEVSP